MANGTPEQIAEWVPQCFGTPEKIQLGAFCGERARRRLRRVVAAHPAVYDEAKDEWVLNGTKTWITNGGIADVHVVVASVDPELRGRGPGQLRDPPDRPGSAMGQKFKKHGIRASHTAEVILDDVRVPGHCLLGGKEKLDERLARAREGKSGRSRRRWRRSRRPPGGRRRPSASPGPPTSTPSSTPRSAASSAGRSSRTSRSPSSSPT